MTTILWRSLWTQRTPFLTRIVCANLEQTGYSLAVVGMYLHGNVLLKSSSHPMVTAILYIGNSTLLKCCTTSLITPVIIPTNYHSPLISTWYRARICASLIHMPRIRQGLVIMTESLVCQCDSGGVLSLHCQVVYMYIITSEAKG